MASLGHSDESGRLEMALSLFSIAKSTHQVIEHTSFVQSKKRRGTEISGQLLITGREAEGVDTEWAAKREPNGSAVSDDAIAEVSSQNLAGGCSHEEPQPRASQPLSLPALPHIIVKAIRGERTNTKRNRNRGAWRQPRCRGRGHATQHGTDTTSRNAHLEC